eukprot:GHVS01034955.1.p1 GENE.GHVS01034955.1~~GHVS01034955.1.p1  ORF type:complete len:563 (-),score=18.79 GHVS01034955.1:293-1981(-)
MKPLVTSLLYCVVTFVLLMPSIYGSRHFPCSSVSLPSTRLFDQLPLSPFIQRRLLNRQSPGIDGASINGPPDREISSVLVTSERPSSSAIPSVRSRFLHLSRLAHVHPSVGLGNPPRMPAFSRGRSGGSNCHPSSLLSSVYSQCSPANVVLKLMGFMGHSNNTELNPSLFVVQQQLREHEFALQDIMRDIGSKVLGYIKNFLGMYCMGMTLLIPYCVDQIERMHRVTLNDPYLLSYYNLPEGASPETYGLPYTDIEIPLMDKPQSNGRSNPKASGMVLRGWVVPCEDPASRKVTICVHGWFANRQSCLPFLGVAHKMGLLKTHHVVLLDMRNSGESSPSRCDIGSNGSQDLFDTISYLHRELGITNVNFYTQSVGSMAALLLAEGSHGRLHSMGVKVDKIVLDSAIASAKEAIKSQPGASALASSFGWLYDILLWILDHRWGKQLDRMRISHLLEGLPRHTELLVMHSAHDGFAHWNLLYDELHELTGAHRPNKVYLFEKGAHANIFRDNPDDYEKVLSNFLKPTFWQYIIPSRLSPRVKRLVPRTFDDPLVVDDGENVATQ